MNKSQQMRWSRRGADLLLQVRCATASSAPPSDSSSKLKSIPLPIWPWLLDPQSLDGPEGQGDDAAHHGKVGDRAGVAAVNPSRRRGAYWTAGDQTGGSGMHGDEPGTDLDKVDGEPVRQQGQQGCGDQEQCKMWRDWVPLYAHPSGSSHQAPPGMILLANHLS